MSTTTLWRPPEGLAVPRFTAESDFESIEQYVDQELRSLGGTAAVVDPTNAMFEGAWFPTNPRRERSNRLMVISALEGGPDANAAAAAIDRVTGQYTPELLVRLGEYWHDAGKSRTDEDTVVASYDAEKRDKDDTRYRDESGMVLSSFPLERRIGMMPHVLEGMLMVLDSALPEEDNGIQIKELLATIVSESHENQVKPSLRYGCGRRLNLIDRRARDADAVSDIYGGLQRPNPQNLRSPYTLAQRFAPFLANFFEGDTAEPGYWSISENNNGREVARTVYNAFRQNHPEELSQSFEEALNSGVRVARFPLHTYIDVRLIGTSDFRVPDGVAQYFAEAEAA